MGNQCGKAASGLCIGNQQPWPGPEGFDAVRTGSEWQLAGPVDAPVGQGRAFGCRLGGRQLALGEGVVIGPGCCNSLTGYVGVTSAA